MTGAIRLTPSLQIQASLACCLAACFAGYSWKAATYGSQRSKITLWTGSRARLERRGGPPISTGALRLT